MNDDVTIPADVAEADAIRLRQHADALPAHLADIARGMRLAADHLDPKPPTPTLEERAIDALEEAGYGFGAGTSFRIVSAIIADEMSALRYGYGSVTIDGVSHGDDLLLRTDVLSLLGVES